jgi:hypothetical protein
MAAAAQHSIFRYSLVDAEDHLICRYPGHGEETQEEPYERWVAVDEADPVGSAVRLVLAALTPVGDCPGDDGLSVAEHSDLGRVGGADGRALSVAAGRSVAQYLATAAVWRLQRSS